jgi:CheY-like chemotaxis protein
MNQDSAVEVLLVDDNPADLELTSEFLSRSRCTSRIHTASNGEEALAFLQRAGEFVHRALPSLIVLDLNLPRKPGHAVLAAIKQDPSMRQVPVVIFSTSQAPADIQRSYELGANSYVRKPGNLGDFTFAVTSIGEFWVCCANFPNGDTKKTAPTATLTTKENA